VSFEVYITPVLYDADELLECLVMADNCLLRGLSLKLHFVTDSDSHIVTLLSTAVVARGRALDLWTQVQRNILKMLAAPSTHSRLSRGQWRDD